MQPLIVSRENWLKARKAHLKNEKALTRMKSLLPYVPLLRRAALAIERFGSTSSAMHVTIRGLDHQSRPITRTWSLLARNNHGPLVPCFPAIALTRKLLRDAFLPRGAMPCVGLLTVDEILDVGRGLDLQTAGDR